MLLGAVERERARVQVQAQLHDETLESNTLAKDFDRIPTRSNTRFGRNIRKGFDEEGDSPRLGEKHSEKLIRRVETFMDSS